MRGLLLLLLILVSIMIMFSNSKRANDATALARLEALEIKFDQMQRHIDLSVSEKEKAPLLERDRDRDRMELPIPPVGVGCYSQLDYWVSRAKADGVALVEEFANYFKERPLQNNLHGMQFDGLFGLFYVARKLQPKYIIESGVYKGLSTWALRKGAPTAKIICLDPVIPNGSDRYFDKEAVYYTGEKFKDFTQIDWKSAVNADETLLVFDDHQSAYHRFTQMIRYGFRHAIFDDDAVDVNHNVLQQLCLPRAKYHDHLIHEYVSKEIKYLSWNTVRGMFYLFEKFRSVYSPLPCISGCNELSILSPAQSESLLDQFPRQSWAGQSYVSVRGGVTHDELLTEVSKILDSYENVDGLVLKGVWSEDTLPQAKS